METTSNTEILSTDSWYGELFDEASATAFAVGAISEPYQRGPVYPSWLVPDDWSNPIYYGHNYGVGDECVAIEHTRTGGTLPPGD